MKIVIRSFYLCAAIAMFASCSPSLTPFTQELYEHGNWSENELRKVQFYVSRDIVLFREFESGDTRISNGKIKMRNGREIEEVVIRSGTPGALLFIPKQNRFAISFEEGRNSPYLMFGPNPKLRNRYALLAKEWKQSFGKVTYAGKLYRVEDESAFASLLVDIDRLGETRVRSKVAQGRQIN